MAARPTDETEKREAKAYARAGAVTPEQPEAAGVFGGEDGAEETEVGEGEASSQDWANAERARPDMPGETPDGLDELTEEVRRQAEDVPTGRRGGL